MKVGRNALVTQRALYDQVVGGLTDTALAARLRRLAGNLSIYPRAERQALLEEAAARLEHTTKEVA
jgi:hypothetical protein